MTRLNWARSRSVGGISEIAVLAPIRKGSAPGERRTHEERLRELIANLARRHEAGLPTELDPVAAIHFGRMLILRPEQYLRPGLTPAPPPMLKDNARRAAAKPGTASLDAYDEYKEAPIRRSASRRAKAAADDAVGEVSDPEDAMPRSWLLVLVEFDGELRTYMRDIAQSVTAFNTVFEHCDDYPGARDFERFWLWIKRYQIAVDLLYTRYRNLSVVRLKYLEAFKQRFDAFAARMRSPAGARVRSVDDAFDAFLRETQQIPGGFPSAGGVYPPSGE